MAKQKIDLVSTVRSEGDGVYSVASESLSGWRYLCYPAIGGAPARCECEDYQRKHNSVRGVYRCKHLRAVRAHLKAQAPKSIAGSQAALGQHLQNHAMTPEEIYLTASERLESGTGDEYTEAACYDAWYASIDLDEDGLCFVEVT